MAARPLTRMTQAIFFKTGSENFAEKEYLEFDFGACY